jgi:hypothetical protein
MEAIRSSETSVITRATVGHIPEHGIPHDHRREKSQIFHRKRLVHFADLNDESRSVCNVSFQQPNALNSVTDRYS